jgi:hypothetical protein
VRALYINSVFLHTMPHVRTAFMMTWSFRNPSPMFPGYSYSYLYMYEYLYLYGIIWRIVVSCPVISICPVSLRNGECYVEVRWCHVYESRLGSGIGRPLFSLRSFPCPRTPSTTPGEARPGGAKESLKNGECYEKGRWCYDSGHRIECVQLCESIRG